jgi:hypothetical protein
LQSLILIYATLAPEISTSVPVEKPTVKPLMESLSRISNR